MAISLGILTQHFQTNPSDMAGTADDVVKTIECLVHDHS